MSLSVGGCLWDGVGETEHADCGVDDQRASAANVLRGAQFADTGVPFVRSLSWQWREYSGVSSMVPNALSRQAISLSLGWGQLPSGGRHAEISRADKWRLGRGGLASDLYPVCAQCPRPESDRGRVAQGQNAFAQPVCAQ